MDTNKLRGVMAERGKTQAEVAKMLNISTRTFYSRMKRGVFGTDEAEKMVKFLRIENPADIFLS